MHFSFILDMAKLIKNHSIPYEDRFLEKKVAFRKEIPKPAPVEEKKGEEEIRRKQNKNLEIPANKMGPETRVHKLCLLLFFLFIILLRLWNP